MSEQPQVPNSAEATPFDPRAFAQQLNEDVAAAAAPATPPAMPMPLDPNASPQAAALSQKLHDLETYGEQTAQDIKRIEIEQLAAAQSHMDAQRQEIAAAKRKLHEFVMVDAALHPVKVVARALVPMPNAMPVVEIVAFTEADGEKEILEYRMVFGVEAQAVLGAFSTAPVA